MVCKRCHSNVPQGATLCPVCGAAVSENTATGNNVQNNERKPNQMNNVDNTIYSTYTPSIDSGKSHIGEILYVIGIVMAVLSVIGGIVIGIALGSSGTGSDYGDTYSYYDTYSSEFSYISFILGLSSGLVSGALMLLISGIGRLVSDVSEIKAIIKLSRSTKQAKDIVLPRL